MKPMLACTCPPLEKLKREIYYALIKYDGIRCWIHPDLGPVSRNLKPIPNRHVRQILSVLPPYLDLELVAGSFQETASAIMSEDGSPSFVGYVFDYFKEPNAPFEARFAEAQVLASGPLKPAVGVLVPTRDLQGVYEDATKNGFEGIIVRAPDAPYKFGRSTQREEGLMRLKPIDTTEGICVKVEQALHNTNEAVRDELGRTKRSSAKGGLVPQPWAGALVLEHHVFGTFKVSGFDQATAKQLWDNPPIGAKVEFEYRGLTSAKKPRHPIFKGLRHDL